MALKSWFITLILVIVPAVAVADENFTLPIARFPFVSAYSKRTVPQPNLQNTPRLDTLIKDGKLMLSLNDAIALALEDNLDLAISRYNLAIAETDIMRAKAGASVRGVAAGLVQGTPGGGIGGFGMGASGAGAGGTSGGAGGAGTGSAGLVQSTLGVGPPVDSYDPMLNAQLLINHVATPLSNTVTTGVPSYEQNIGGANVSYSQAFATGTKMAVEFNNSRLADNSVFSILVPQVNSSLRLTLRQHLLSGFGFGPNLRFIRIARNNREISDVAFRNQVIATVSQIQNIYWDLVNAYEDAGVKERSLALAEKLLADNREQERIGSMAPIEVTRAANEVASRKQEAILARTTLRLQQLLMKNAITKTLNDPVIAAVPVVPTDTMILPENEPAVPVQDLITEALAHRPELIQGRIDLSNRDISKKAAANELLPAIDLLAWYGTSGLAGVQNAQNPQLAPGAVLRTGFSNAFSRLFANDFPDYAVGISINLPLRNRAARADQIRSELEFRQAQLRLQQLQNQIGIEVRNADFTAEENRARVDAARTARDLARHTSEIEEKKRSLGASTSVDVMQAQRDLAQAESALVAAMSAYEKSRVELDRVTGRTLLRNGIDVEDAERGQVMRMPAIPGVVPREGRNPVEDR
jgi:outer membrane protein TolC